MNSDRLRLHTLDFNPEHDQLPSRFTYPFHYEPHPLCRQAAQMVQAEIIAHPEWRREAEQGKMFGVLVVSTPDRRIGFFAAFSGILNGQNDWPYFVPPVYDLLKPDGFFKTGEAQISELNQHIRQLETGTEYLQAEENLKRTEQQAEEEIEKARCELQKAKSERDRRRTQGITDETEQAFIRESQFQKAEFKRLERAWKTQIENCRHKFDTLKHEIESLKQERKTRSATLQEQLFSRFVFLNANGEQKDLCHIFHEYGRPTPPAGSGECAAPKLLQYAYLNHCHPLAMAEFWWGASPKDVIRRQGAFYPSCRSKCEPILWHMLQGLEVDPDPITEAAAQIRDIQIIYEDEWLTVINKPAGMLSVPGKTDAPSVWKWAQTRYPETDGPLIVHRLDMATSGLLLIAKTKEIHKQLQAMFESRDIKKRYMALLDGTVADNKGFIRLPLCPDPSERPRQMVNHEFGKPAVTRYEVLSRTGQSTRIAFYPQTGRTHQLRMHAAHPEGLNAPIKGDELYGTKADRLYLHADMLVFRHPVSGKMLTVESPAPF